MVNECHAALAFVAGANLRLREHGDAAAAEQKALFAAHRTALEGEWELMQLRLEYLAGKVAYWEAVEAGDMDKARKIAEANLRMAKTIARKKEGL